MVTPLWIVWIVFCCFFTLVQMVKPQSSAATLLAPIGLVGAMSWFVWLTDGRFAAFAVLGSLAVYSGLLLLTRLRAGGATPAGFKAAAIGLVSPAVFFGTVVGGAVEIGGRWSGPDFVVWRAALAGGLLFAAGMALFVRATRASPVDEEEPQD